MRWFTAFFRSADGPTAVEYAVMLGLVFLVVLSSIIVLGQRTSTSINNSSTTINAATGS